MKCLGVYQNHRLYIDLKHNEFLLMTPNMRFTRVMGHCHNYAVKNWAYRKIEQYRSGKIKCNFKME